MHYDESMNIYSDGTTGASTARESNICRCTKKA